MKNLLNQLNNFCCNNRNILFYLFFFVFYLMLGFIFTGFNNSYIHHLNLTLYSDTARVYHEMVTTVGPHHEEFSHPFFALISQSCVALIKLFIPSTRFSIIIFISLCSVSSIFLIKKCIEKLTDNISSALIISLIYGFSFSTLVYGTMPETYLLSSLTNLLCIYYIIHLIKSDVKELTIKNIIVLVGLGLLNFGILYSNILLDIIYIVFLLINVYSKNIKQILVTLLKVIILFAVSGIFLSLFQKLMFPEHDMFFWHLAVPAEHYFNFNLDFNKLLWVIKCNYFNCLYCFNIQTLKGNTVLALEHAGLFKLISALLFYGLIVFNYIKNHKNITDNLKFAYLFIFILGFNLLSNLVFNVSECFLFSQTTLIFIMLLCGIILGNAKDNILKWICYLLILTELIQNTRVFKNIIYPHISSLNTQAAFNVLIPVFYSIITGLSFFILILIFKNLLINKNILNETLENKFFITLSLFFGYMILFIIFNVMFQGYEDCFIYART